MGIDVDRPTGTKTRGSTGKRGLLVWKGKLKGKNGDWVNCLGNLGIWENGHGAGEQNEKQRAKCGFLEDGVWSTRDENTANTTRLPLHVCKAFASKDGKICLSQYY